ncbi:Acetyltransferase (isoleucine patch superfamily)- like protein [Desulfofarcimen acetoxidans DSM 771]|uniref:Acetyltransferase (Isoleucine patch superfamily)-like protein n=1 Tax=Desulfofarcimen acetoxidans (strain ATCC 49208 / DSM 771 / KCTC 5769 / VKM B-1644 / 5575) TaxID=485916 RepID=C8VYP6_DESAS|nr:acyltransferase [Desulfofarcimen acetoxidans]ACV64767.1 Acetyltransferase (isoleucine patch superfamily)- like protein [Desulfofarcimen acetoxidans DSM 771]
MVILNFIKILKSYIRLLLCKVVLGKKLKLRNFFYTYIDSFVNIEINKNGCIFMGKNVRIRKMCNLKCTSGIIRIGNNVFFNNFVSLNCREHIEVGDDCLFGENVKIYDHDHTFRQGEKTSMLPIVSQRIIIGNNVWIGANVVILKGVSIGDNAVIGAGSLINKDVGASTIIYNKKDNIIKSI